MSTPAKRKSHLFSSLKLRTSFRDLHIQLKGPPVKEHKVKEVKRETREKEVTEKETMKPATPEKPLLKPASMSYGNTGRIARPDTKSEDYVLDIGLDSFPAPEFSDDSSEYTASLVKVHKRSSTVFKTKASPSSEKTLTTLLSLSDLGSLDTLFMDHPSLDDSLADLEPLENNIKHLNYTGYIDLDLDEPCMPTKLRRTSNYGNINKFVTNKSMVPLGNRASLELEAKEIRDHTSKMAENASFTCRMIENAFTMTFFQSDLDAACGKDVRYWDDLDYDDALKSDWDSTLDPLVS